MAGPVTLFSGRSGAPSVRTGIWRFCNSAATAVAALRLRGSAGVLGGGPGAEGAAIVLPTAVGKQRGVDAHAVAAGGRVHGDVDGGVIGVGEDGALVERQVGIGVAQHQRRDAAAFEFLPQAAGERDGDVFFEQRGAESFSVIVAAVAGVDDREVAAEDLWWREPAVAG